MATPATENKMKELLTPVFTEVGDKIINQVNQNATVNSTELALSIERINAKLDLIIGQLAGKKTGASRAKPAISDPSQPAPADGTPAKTETAEVTVPANKMLYFKKLYKEDPAFKAKFADPQLIKEITESKVINEKTNPQQKLAAETTFAWNWIKQRSPELVKLLEELYAQAKKDAAEVVKAPNETVDVSPTAGAVVKV